MSVLLLPVLSRGEAPAALLPAALDLLRRGLRPIPLHTVVRGTCTCSKGTTCDSPGKHPAIPDWKQFQARAPTKAEVCAWFKGPPRNVGLVLFDGMAVIDFDDAKLFWRALKTRKFAGAYMVKTPRPGFHVYVHEKRPSKSRPIIPGRLDVKAAGGYIVAPPSSRDGQPYLAFGPSRLLEVENAEEFVRGILAIPGVLGKPATLAAMGTEATPLSEPARGAVGAEPGWIAAALADLKPGNRNATFAKLAGRLHRDHHAPEDIKAILAPHAEDAKFGAAELEAVIKSVSRYPRGSSSSFPVVGATTTALTSRPLSVMLAEASPEIVWLVEGLFPDCSLNILGGPPGGGKTWLLLDLSIETARGGKWLGRFQAKQGKVLYIDCEAGARLLRPRYTQMLQAKGLTASEELPIEIVDSQVIHLTDSASLADLRALVGRTEPALVIMDSLVRFHAAEENSASEMAQVSAAVQGIIRDFGVAVVFADHVRKAPGLPGSMDLSLRGSGEKVAAADTVLSLRKERGHLIVEHSKSRWDKPIASFEAEIEDEVSASGKATRVRWLRTLEDLEDKGFDDEDQQAVIEYLDAFDDWTPRQKIVGDLRKKLAAKRVDQALTELVEKGRVERKSGSAERGGRVALYRAAGAGGAETAAGDVAITAAAEEPAAALSPPVVGETTTTRDAGPTPRASTLDPRAMLISADQKAALVADLKNEIASAAPTQGNLFAESSSDRGSP